MSSASLRQPVSDLQDELKIQSMNGGLILNEPDKLVNRLLAIAHSM